MAEKGVSWSWRMASEWYDDGRHRRRMFGSVGI